MWGWPWAISVLCQGSWPTTSQGAWNEMQHSSFSKSRYWLQHWAPQHSEDTQENELSGSPMVDRLELLLRNTCTTARTFLHLCSPYQEGWAFTQGAGRGHRWDSWPQLIRGISHPQQHDQHIELGEVGDVHRVLSVLPTSCNMLWSPDLLEMAEHLPDNEKC